MKERCKYYLFESKFFVVKYLMCFNFIEVAMSLMKFFTLKFSRSTVDV